MIRDEDRASPVWGRRMYDDDDDERYTKDHHDWFYIAVSTITADFTSSLKFTVFAYQIYGHR